MPRVSITILNIAFTFAYALCIPYLDSFHCTFTWCIHNMRYIEHTFNWFCKYLWIEAFFNIFLRFSFNLFRFISWLLAICASTTYDDNYCIIVFEVNPPLGDILPHLAFLPRGRSANWFYCMQYTCPRRCVPMGTLWKTTPANIVCSTNSDEKHKNIYIECVCCLSTFKLVLTANNSCKYHKP